MMNSDPVLFDTNVLIYQQDTDSIFHSEAASYHQKVINKEINAIFSTQNLAEFVSAMNNPRRIKNPVAPNKVKQEIDKYLSLPTYYSIIYPNSASLDLFLDFVGKIDRPVNFRKIYDIFLIATMLGNNVKTILTANVDDFKEFKDKIKIIDLKN